MGSRGSNYNSGNSIKDAKDWDELQDALSKAMGGKVRISPDLREKGDIERIKKAMSAVNRMVEILPILKGNDLEMVWEAPKKEEGTINGMTAFGELAFYKQFYEKGSTKSFPPYGHPANFNEEQCIAHELGHYVEGLLLQKMFPNVSPFTIVRLYRRNSTKSCPPHKDSFWVKM